MTREVQMWIVPLLAMIFGLLIFFNTKDKMVTIGGYLFLCGLFIVLWLLTFGGLPLRL